MVKVKETIKNHFPEYYLLVLETWKEVIEKSQAIQWSPLIEECQQLSLDLILFGINQTLLTDKSQTIFGIFKNWIEKEKKYIVFFSFLINEVSDEKTQDIQKKIEKKQLEGLRIFATDCFENKNFNLQKGIWINQFLSNLPKQTRNTWMKNWLNLVIEMKEKFKLDQNPLFREYLLAFGL
jgi:hypothetical protein